MIGTRLGPYEITARLGEGGMGEVYRATDSNLRREVAIKVLPPAFTADAERLARFEREAQLLAQLHHPNIASIFGLEVSGGARALVLELVPGPTLAERLERGPLPLAECLSVAAQIAQALEAAHEKGIVHRDLKPQNIKASSAGKVKVLDFGLAKALAPLDPLAGSASAADLARSPTLMNSPTLTAVALVGGTELGVILGTAGYMSPEQARGGAVDRRADIWAFGVVLYEMLTGKRLFEGGSAVDTISAVMRQEIDYARLPAGAPRRLRELLRRCLERNPKNRLHDIADARIVLDELVAGGEGDEPAAGSPAGVRPSPVWRIALPWVLAVLAAALWAFEATRRPDADASSPRLSRLPLDLGEESISLSFGAGAVLSPDGRRVAWVTGGRLSRTASDSRIVVRDLDAAESRPLAGTEGAQDPVFSPDGTELAYFGATSLFKVPVAGGVPVRLAEVGLPRGVTWADDGTLIYNRDVSAGLWRVPASGGAPELLTAPESAADERSHRWPRAVRGSRKILFLAQALGQKYEESTIELLDLDSRKRTVLHRGGSYPRITRDGFLLYARDRALWAAPLDLAAGRLTRQPARVLDEIGYSDWSGGAQFDVADDGTLIYSTGRSDEAVEISWLDPSSGAFGKVAFEPAFYYEPALARDGHSLALQLYSVGRSDLWIFDLSTGNRRRLTFGGRDEHPVWSPDGASIAYSHLAEGATRGMVKMRVDGAGEPVGIAPGKNARFPTSWSVTGALLFTERSPETHSDIWVAWPERPDRAPEPLLVTPANESRAVFSPDGRWVLYESDESGSAEIYARSFSGGGGRWQLSESGGAQPRWAVDGSAVYYWGRGGLSRREVREAGGALAPGRTSSYRVERPTLRTEDSGYVVGGDGRLLLFPFAAEARGRTRTVLVLGWAEELRRKLGGAG
mgnify:FL=1